MTIEEMKTAFEGDDGAEFLKFDRIENKRHERPDIHAFLLLAELDKAGMDIIAGAEHEEIFLSPSPAIVARKITPEQCVELARCGVMFRENDGFTMFA